MYLLILLALRTRRSEKLTRRGSTILLPFLDIIWEDGIRKLRQGAGNFRMKNVQGTANVINLADGYKIYKNIFFGARLLHIDCRFLLAS